jgi:hypothetical protein
VIIGSGSLGKTFFVTNKSQNLMVLKHINLSEIDMDHLELYLNSYEIHPFIENLEIVWIHNSKLLLLFELQKGGDLYQNLR